jgi:hypothetical protein
MGRAPPADAAARGGPEAFAARRTAATAVAVNPLSLIGESLASAAALGLAGAARF